MNETSPDYAEFIPRDEEEAQRRLEAVTSLSLEDLQALGDVELLMAWWSFFWLNPGLHPDDREEWPDDVESAAELAAEAACRYQDGDLADGQYYPNDSTRDRLRAAMPEKETAEIERNMLSWNALLHALTHAGVVIADESEPVTVIIGETLPDGAPVILLTPYDRVVSHMILKSLNEKVKAVGSSIFVTASVLDGDEEQEFQLSIFKTWVVEHDLALSQIK